MIDKIKEQPILGNGFGTEIQYESDDPRIREQDISGKRKTYAFEWGWLEIMVKMGFLGLGGFIILGISSLYGLMGYLKTEKSWLAVGFITSLIMLYGTHIFSPYLNHPIGIGFLLFLIPFFHESHNLSSISQAKESIESLKTMIGSASKTFDYPPIQNSILEKNNHE
jgi:O-antigen ligase